jgi:DNA-binding HxlR family transcriptional regulator
MLFSSSFSDSDYTFRMADLFRDSARARSAACVRRYEGLRRSTDVTNATLSDRLRHLEDNGLIERRQYQSNPERYEYVLTQKGRDVILVIQALAQVGDKWAVAGDAGPPLKFVDRKTGHSVKLAMVDSETGQRVRAHDLLPQEGPGADDLVRWRLTHFRK